ncbi:MAG: hypothetical protein ACQGVK_22025 [Myxococcota bacterium]
MKRPGGTAGWAIALALLGCIAPAAALAQARAEADRQPVRPRSNAERLEAMRAEAEQEAALKAEWQDLYRNAIERERKARAELEAARAAWSRGRVDNRLRGDRKARAQARLEAAEKELGEARAELSALPERARQAGVQPGWLRQVEDELASPPAAN